MSRLTVSLGLLLTLGWTTPAGAVPAPDKRVERPVRVLLAAGAPTRDYQFVRTLFFRQMELQKADLCICLQAAPGQEKVPPGRVQNVASERLLTHFPDRYAGEDKDNEDRYYNLSSYDVVIAFDLDWSRLENKQLELLPKWVDKGGGLIVVGGPLHTLQLARPDPKLREKLKPLLDLLPVHLKDSRVEADRDKMDGYALDFPGATAEMGFLKLEEGKDAELLDGWKKFFGKPGKNERLKVVAERGFYTFYPVEKVKPGATVIATFGDSEVRMSDGKAMPYLVAMPFGKGRVLWLGSGETWRLRGYKESYFDRFWSQFARHAAGIK